MRQLDEAAAIITIAIIVVVLVGMGAALLGLR
jgi:hypothetical protein